MKKLKVFISSPYTLGDKEENVKKSLEVANILIKKGFLPFAPLIYHYQHLLFPQTEEVWLAFDIDWMLECDVVLRLPGESVGADNEVKVAKENNIPVFYDIESLIEYRNVYVFNKIQTT